MTHGLLKCRYLEFFVIVDKDNKSVGGSVFLSHLSFPVLEDLSPYHFLSI